MQWIRIRHNGIYQLVSITDTFDGFETHLDVTDGKGFDWKGEKYESYSI